MALSVSDAVIPTTKHTVEVDVHMTTDHPHHLDFSTSKGGAQEADEFYDEVEVDANMSPDLPYDFEKERLQKEKQISVDPISLQGSSMGKASFKLMLPPLPPAEGFLSCSLPNSANSSPRFNSAPLKKKSRDGSKANPRQVSNLARQHSAADDHVLSPLQRETYLQRSKSCYEGKARALADDFELWLTKPNSIEYDHKYDISFSKTEPSKDSHKYTRSMGGGDEEFKCGALCLFLPGFGKGKPVRAKKEVVDIEHVVNIENVISRSVSLEKFECGSWASSAITHDSEDDSKSLYFDLPLELIRTSVNDAHSPVTAAFFFDNDKKRVLKNGSARSTAKKSDESPCHVRFSLSSPRSHPTSPASCITPRLRKAREEFNAFLEAQGA
nr:uncharacterized protein LOC112030839 [Quercus suber]